MKKWIVTIMIMCLCRTAQGKDPNDGWGLWALGEQNMSTGSLFNFRGSYLLGSVEPYLGFQTGFTRDIPDVFSMGVLVHSNDVVEPNNIPIVSDFVTKILNEDLVLKGYTGFHSSLTLNNKGTFFGTIVGVQFKDKPESPLSIIAEVQFNNIANELKEAGIDTTKLFLGILWRFK